MELLGRVKFITQEGMCNIKPHSQPSGFFWGGGSPMLMGPNPSQQFALFQLQHNTPKRLRGGIFRCGESYFKFCAYHGLFCVLSILIILNNVMTQIVILIGVLEIRTKDWRRIWFHHWAACSLYDVLFCLLGHHKVSYPSPINWAERASTLLDTLVLYLTFGVLGIRTQAKV